MTIIQQFFIDTLVQQQAILKTQHQQSIKAIYIKLYNAKALILKTLVPTPFINKIEITIFKLSLLNTNPKLVIVT